MAVGGTIPSFCYKPWFFVREWMQYLLHAYAHYISSFFSLFPHNSPKKTMEMELGQMQSPHTIHMHTTFAILLSAFSRFKALIICSFWNKILSKMIQSIWTINYFLPISLLKWLISMWAFIFNPFIYLFFHEHNYIWIKNWVQFC